MAKSKKCIVTGRDTINGVFYMINNETTTIPDISYTVGGEDAVRNAVRKEDRPKIFESVSEATSLIKWLRTRDESFRQRWSLEYR